MILVDTSVWVEHLRRGLPRLATLLQEGEVLPLGQKTVSSSGSTLA